MDAIEAITQRVSVAQLSGPEPSPSQLDILFNAALRAADHAWLRPSRFLVIKGEARQSLGDVYLSEILRNTARESLSAEKREKLRHRLMRAPIVIVAITRVQDHPKVSREEQLMSTAAGVQNMLNAAWALGLGAIWRTGDMVHNLAVKDALGLSGNEEITGFIYLGAINTVPKTAPDLDLAEFVADWSPKILG
ncbi:MAG: nitroreductase [Oleibacter sp.]|nr:nitroreductase [Thalassolituus sp.]